MVENLIFMTGLGVFLSLLSFWGFKILPREKWQVLGTIPILKLDNGKWKGLNLTYYGIFNGLATSIGAMIMLVLLGSASVPFSGTILFIFLILIVAAPAAKIVARIVEKKPSTLSIGGASFVGIVTAPWIAKGISLLFLNYGLPEIDIMILLAAVSTSYAFGEAVGRLGCISFGCCYGKPISELPHWVQILFGNINFVFQGKTKKIAYADEMDGKKILPIQGITSILYSLTGLVGVYCFISSNFLLSFLITLSTTQIWRVISEFFRADYRGEGKISVYQYLAIISVVYAIGISFLFDSSPIITISIKEGIKQLWEPQVILSLQGLWLSIFAFTGRSKVINAELSFQVNLKNI